MCSFQSPYHASRTPSQALSDDDITLFDTAEEVWFWFIQAQQARLDGARICAGAGLYKRPCEPIDILKILDRLHRQRILSRDHLLVLRHYGRRQIRPDATYVQEARASAIWDEALDKLARVFISKGLMHAPVLPFMPTFSSGQEAHR